MPHTEPCPQPAFAPRNIPALAGQPAAPGRDFGHDRREAIEPIHTAGDDTITCVVKDNDREDDLGDLLELQHSDTCADAHAALAGRPGIAGVQTPPHQEPTPMTPQPFTPARAAKVLRTCIGRTKTPGKRPNTLIEVSRSASERIFRVPVGPAVAPCSFGEVDATIAVRLPSAIDHPVLDLDDGMYVAGDILDMLDPGRHASAGPCDWRGPTHQPLTTQSIQICGAPKTPGCSTLSKTTSTTSDGNTTTEASGR